MGRGAAGRRASSQEPTADYVRFATHDGFGPDFCHGSDPESKGWWNTWSATPKRDLIVPQAPTIDDLSAANTAAATWCVEVNTAVHSEICAVSADRLEAERPLRAPLPSLRPQLLDDPQESRPRPRPPRRSGPTWRPSLGRDRLGVLLHEDLHVACRDRFLGTHRGQHSRRHAAPTRQRDHHPGGAEIREELRPSRGQFR
jgi:hypothetical protein